MEDVTIINNIKCNETIWLRIKVVSGVDLYVGYVYTLTQCKIKQLGTDRFNLLEEDICMFQSKGRVLLLGVFNARVGKSEDVGNVIGMFGENTCLLFFFVSF